MAIKTAYLFISMVVLNGALFAQSSEQKRFSLSIRPYQKIIPAGSEIRLEVTVTNTFDRTIGIYETREDPASVYILTVNGVHGERLPYTEQGRKLARIAIGGYAASGAVTYLTRGEALKDDLIVNKLYDMNLPGDYVVQAERLNRIYNSDDGGSGVVKSNAVTITVSPSADMARRAGVPARAPDEANHEEPKSATSPALADAVQSGDTTETTVKLRMRDGTVKEGRYVDGTPRIIRTRINGKVEAISVSQVADLEFLEKR